MGEQHLDLLALTAADREFFGVGQVADDLPGIFIHVAGHGLAGAVVQDFRIGQVPQVSVSAL